MSLDVEPDPQDFSDLPRKGRRDKASAEPEEEEQPVLPAFGKEKLASPVAYRVGTAADPALDVEFDEEADGGPEADETPAVQPPEPETVPEPAKPAPPPVTVFGEVFSTYILCQIGEEFVLIDKHAAHERIRYNRLKAEGKPSAASCCSRR